MSEPRSLAECPGHAVTGLERLPPLRGDAGLPGWVPLLASYSDTPEKFVWWVTPEGVAAGEVEELLAYGRGPAG